jgi:RNA polymerase sigma-70 factor (ECF subfamily)
MQVQNPREKNCIRKSNNCEELNLPEENIFPEDQTISAEFIEELDTAIRRLPDIMKSAIILREIEGYTYREIGGILNCSRNTVKSQLYNARRQLIINLSYYL